MNDTKTPPMIEESKGIQIFMNRTLDPNSFINLLLINDYEYIYVRTKEFKCEIILHNLNLRAPTVFNKRN